MKLYELARYIHPDTEIELKIKDGRSGGYRIFKGFSHDLPMRYADLKILSIRIKDDYLLIGIEDE